MSNEFVKVSREVAEAAWQALDDEGRFEESCPLRAELDKPAEQHQGEPVALPARKPQRITDARAEGWNACLDEIAKLGPLYAHPAPSDPGEVERMTETAAMYSRLRDEANAEVERLAILLRQTQVKHAQERDALRAQLAEAHALLRECQPALENAGFSTWQIDELLSAGTEPIAKQEFREHLDKCAAEVATWPDWKREALGQVKERGRIPHPVNVTDPSREVLQLTFDHGSPENSEYLAPGANFSMHGVDLPGLAIEGAPVDIDERAEFESHTLRECPDADLECYGGGIYRNNAIRDQWAGWQARAALERKP